MAHHTVELANEMICDPIAAKKSRLAGRTVSYKLRYELAMGFENWLKNLKKGFFSSNQDEVTSTTHHKVLTLLVSYFCEHKTDIIVEHLTSLNLPIINSETVYDTVATIFQSKELP